MYVILLPALPGNALRHYIVVYTITLSETLSSTCNRLQSTCTRPIMVLWLCVGKCNTYMSSIVTGLKSLSVHAYVCYHSMMLKV